MVKTDCLNNLSMTHSLEKATQKIFTLPHVPAIFFKFFEKFTIIQKTKKLLCFPFKESSAKITVFMLINLLFHTDL